MAVQFLENNYFRNCSQRSHNGYRISKFRFNASARHHQDPSSIKLHGRVHMVSSNCMDAFTWSHQIAWTRSHGLIKLHGRVHMVSSNCMDAFTWSHQIAWMRSHGLIKLHGRVHTVSSNCMDAFTWSQVQPHNLLYTLFLSSSLPLQIVQQA